MRKIRTENNNKKVKDILPMHTLRKERGRREAEPLVCREGEDGINHVDQ